MLDTEQKETTANTDPDSFLAQWQPELKKTHMSFCLPFVMPAVICGLVWFFGLPQPGAAVLCIFAIACGVGYIIKSLVAPGETLQQYGWLQWDRLENEKVEAERRFIDALVSAKIITRETKARSISYEIETSTPGTLVVVLDIKQAGMTYQNLQGRIESTAPALGAFSVETRRIGNTQFRIVYSFQDPTDLYRAGAVDDDERAPGDPFRVAYHAPGNEPITLPSTRSFRAIIAGSSGSGKSVLLQKLLCEIASAGKDHQCVILDPKRVSFVDYADRFHVVSDPDNFTAALDALYNEMMRRYDWMQQNGVQEVPISEMPLIYLVVDEVAELFDSAPDKKEKDLRIKRLTQLATLSRQSGFCLCLATQTPSTECLPSTLRNQLDFRLIMRMFNKKQTELVCPDGMEQECPAYLIPEDLPGVGYFLTSSTDNHFAMGRVYKFSMDDVRKVVKETAKDKIELPWLNEAKPLPSRGGLVAR